MFFDLLNIKTPDWYQTFISGRRLTCTWDSLYGFGFACSVYSPVLYGRGKPNPVPEPPPKPPERIGLSEQYIGLLLFVLVKAGLVDVRKISRNLSRASD